MDLNNSLLPVVSSACSTENEKRKQLKDHIYFTPKKSSASIKRNDV